MKKRLLSLVLCLVMVFSLFPAFGMNALAAQQALPDTPAGVSVTYDDSLFRKVETFSNYYSFTIKKNQTAVFTFTNTGADSAQISFRYKSVYASDFTVKINGISKSVSSSYTPFNSDTLTHNGTVVLEVTPAKDSITFNIEKPIVRNVAGDPSTMTNPGAQTVKVGATKTVAIGVDHCSVKENGATSSNTGVATVSTSGNNVVITGVSAGTATITVEGVAESGYSKPANIQFEVTVSEGAQQVVTYNEVTQHNLYVGQTIGPNETLKTTEDYYVKRGDNYYLVTFTPGDEVYEQTAPTGWTAKTGVGYFYKTGAEQYYEVNALQGDALYRAFSNKLIASKSGEESDGMITGPDEAIGSWRSGTSNAYVVGEDGQLHQVLYANKGSTFHYNMFIYYKNGNDVVYLNQGANEHDGISKYGSDSREGVGADYYTYNNTLGSYGGKGYYTGKYYKPTSLSSVASETINNQLYYSADGEHQTVINNVNNGNDGKSRYDDEIIYHGDLYKSRRAIVAYSWTDASGKHTVKLSESTLNQDYLYDTNDIWANEVFYTKHVEYIGGEGGEGGDDTPTFNPEPDEPGILVSSQSAVDGDLHMNKALYMDPDTGLYNIRMDAWSTGEIKTETTVSAVPTDFVLVLDLSNSMNDDRFNIATTYQQDPTATFGNTNDDDNPHYIKIGETYHRLYRDQNTTDVTPDTLYRSFYTNIDHEKVYITSGSPQYGNQLSNYLLPGYDASQIYKMGDTTTRLEPLKTAVAAFIQAVQAADEGEGKYRIAITGYNTNGYVFEPTKTQEVPGNYNSAAALFNVNTQSTQLAAAQQNIAVDKDDPYTRMDLGLGLAKDILDHRDNTNVNNAGDKPKPIVILFTDGEPNTTGRCGDTINNAKALKDSGADIYTVGIFKQGDYHTMVNGINRYTWELLEAASSDYPSATSTKHGTDSGTLDINFGGSIASPTHQYYTVVNDTNALTNAFTTIAQTSINSGSKVGLGTDAYLRDIINTDNFALPDGFSATNVDAYAVKAGNVSSSGGISWSDKITRDESKTINGKTEKIIDLESDDAVTVVTEPGSNDTATNTVVVSGYDYANTFTATDGNNKVLGYKLVVRVTGIMPSEAGVDLTSNKSAGVYYMTEEGEEPAVEVEKDAIDVASPVETVRAVSKIIDFNTIMEFLPSGLKADKALFLGNDASVDTLSPKGNGVFTITPDGGVNYQLKPGVQLQNATENGGTSFVMNGAESAMVFSGDYGKDNEGNQIQKPYWTKLTAIPANNIYFDDDLLSKTITTEKIDGTGYNVDVTTSSADRLDNYNQGETTTMQQKVLYFTFKGTGIDVYCTTSETGGYVRAQLFRGTSAVAANRVGDTINMRNYSASDRYNVPTVSIREQNYDTYTLMLLIPANTNYQLDGIRIYNALDNEGVSQKVYQDTDEANAHFVNLRKYLLDDHSDYDVHAGTTTSVNKLGPDNQPIYDDNGDPVQEFQYMTGDEISATVGENPVTGEDTVGVLFMDNVYTLVKGDDGETAKQYQSTFAAYQSDGPKNEIYLAKNQGVTFQLGTGYQNNHYWVGLSAPDASDGTGSVYVNVDTAESVINVTSPVDMYYDITPFIGQDGSVTIVNKGDAMISITNLKYTSPYVETVTFGTPLRSLTMRSVMLAANNGGLFVEDTAQEPVPTETPEPTHQPGIQDIVKQIISNFVQAIFRSIARLFGN